MTTEASPFEATVQCIPAARILAAPILSVFVSLWQILQQKQSSDKVPVFHQSQYLRITAVTVLSVNEMALDKIRHLSAMHIHKKRLSLLVQGVRWRYCDFNIFENNELLPSISERTCLNFAYKYQNETFIRKG